MSLADERAGLGHDPDQRLPSCAPGHSGGAGGGSHGHSRVPAPRTYLEAASISRLDFAPLTWPFTVHRRDSGRE
jgi:hypothetical protein